jgi:hypothetical protein
MWLFRSAKDKKIEQLLLHITLHPEEWNKNTQTEIISFCESVKASKRTIRALQKLIHKHPKIGKEVKMTLEKYLHNHPHEFEGLEHHTAKEVKKAGKLGLVPRMASWGFGAAAAAYISLFGVPTGNEARYLNVPVAIAQEGMRLPDLSGAKYLGTKHKDRFKEIPGNDTTLRGYKLGNKTITTYEFPNGKIFGFILTENNNKKYYWDTNASGTFELGGKSADINLDKYF